MHTGTSKQHFSCLKFGIDAYKTCMHVRGQVKTWNSLCFHQGGSGIRIRTRTSKAEEDVPDKDVPGYKL
jgi:hypothetical protein